MRLIGWMVLVGCGCAGFRELPQEFEPSEQGRFFPEVRVSYTFERKEPGEWASAGSGIATTRGYSVAIEGSLAGTQGSFTEDLPDGPGLSFGGGTITAPRSGLRGDYDLYLVAVDARFRLERSRGSGRKGLSHLDVLLGLGVTSLDLEVSDGATTLSDHFVNPCFHMGFRGEWMPGHVVGFTASLDMFLGEDSVGRGCAGLTFHAGRRASVVAGWHVAAYTRETDDLELSLRTSGPFAGLRFDF